MKILSARQKVKRAAYLALCLCAVIFAFPVPVHGQEALKVLEWYTIDKPGPAGNIVINPSEISKVAVSTGNYIFVIDSPNKKVYRSRNSGSTWEDITSTAIASGIPLPSASVRLDNIAVAPDKASLLALVTYNSITNLSSVYISTDGGDSWSNMNYPGPAGIPIRCITFSKAYALNLTTVVWDMAVGTAVWNDNNTDGELWISQVGGTSIAWKNQNISITGPNAEVSAIAFSPGYNQQDQAILVTGSVATGANNAYRTYLCIGKRDVNTSTTAWNTIAAPISYPVLIADSSLLALADRPVAQIISSIALPSDYNSALFGGTTSDGRVAFVSYTKIPLAAANNQDDVYRIYDSYPAMPYRLNAGSATADSYADISSIALSGSINASAPVLLAGDYRSLVTPFVYVRRCTNPFARSPDFPAWESVSLSQPPTGPGGAQVAFGRSSSQAYCGTGQNVPGVLYDESAFSVSSDAGKTWQQVSLINTSIRICDVQPAPDSKSLLVATTNPNFGGLEWVWRCAGEPLGQYWGRLYGLDTTTNRIIIRLSPNYESDYTVYVGETESATGPQAATSYLLAVSHDRGNTWIKRNMPAHMLDMVLADSQTAYVALPDGKIRKTQNEGMQWQAPAEAKFENINMLHRAKNGDIFAASRNGKVSYSTDNGATFTLIPSPVTNYDLDTREGDVQVTTDASYVTNKIIYAADNIPDHGMWRWQIGSSTRWELINKTVMELGSGEQFCGLAMGDEGTLYGLRLEPKNTYAEKTRDSITANVTTGGMDRSLNPTAGVDYTVEWDVVNRTIPEDVSFDPNALFSHTMPFLKFSGDLAQNELWTFDSYPASILAGTYIVPQAIEGSSVRIFPGFTAKALLTVGTVPGIDQLSVKLQHSDSAGGPWVDSGDIFANVTSANDEATYTLSYTGNKSYIRAVAALSGTAGTLIPFEVLVQNENQVIYRFIDNVCKSGPYIDNLAEIGCDPVTGRNQAVDLRWEQLSITDTHEVHLDKSKSWDKPMLSEFIIPYDVTSPAMVYLAGGEGIGGGSRQLFLNDVFHSTVSDNVTFGLDPVPSLECGHNFYWHVRARHAVTDEYIRSPWSDIGQFVIKAGFKVTTPYYGPQLLAPKNACGCACNAPVSFSWSPYKETTGYWFELSKNADMSNPLVHTVINQSTAYQYTGQLQCNTTYYWRVMAQRPTTSEWSAVFSFKTQPQAQETKQVMETPVGVKLYIWFMIGVGTMLMVCLLLLIVQRSRREE